MDALSQIDLAFCMDLTSSMTPFVELARVHVLDILTGLEAGSAADLRVAVVEYRDYGGRGQPVQSHAFSADAAEVRRVVGRLKVSNAGKNTDAAEAVFAGLLACADELAWRPQAVRALILIGDAPPHGCGASASPFPDRYLDGDPTGETLMSMGGRVEAAGITLHALGILPSVIPVHDAVTERCFSWLAQTTGGTYRVAHSAGDAMGVVEVLGGRVFGDMDFDRRIWEHLGRGECEPTDEELEAIGQTLRAPLYEVHASLERLKKRRLFPGQDS